MSPSNYIPFETATLDPASPWLDDVLDLDVLLTEEGILINVSPEE
jgi:hypothetical protein